MQSVGTERFERSTPAPKEELFFFSLLSKNHLYQWRAILESNLMYTALVPSLNRAIRIIQVSPEEEGELFISGWLNSLDLNEEQSPVDELVISLVLSQKTKAIANEFIHAWLVEQVNGEKMDQLLEEKIILATS